MKTLKSTTEKLCIEFSEQYVRQLLVLKGILESFNSLVFSVDENFNYTSFNKAHAAGMKLLYNADIEINKNILDYMTVDEDRNTARLNLSKALSGQHLVKESYAGEAQLTRLHYEVSHTPIFDDHKHIIGVAVVAKDITEVKRSEERLKKSEKSYRRLFESAKDGILILDALTGEIVDVNPFLTDMLGYSHQELLGKELWEIGVFKNIAASKEDFVELQINEYIRFEDKPLESRSGQQINVEFISNVYLVDNVKVIQCNIRDITERIVEREQLIIAKANAEESDRLKTAFLHNVSHEIRTPMNAIVGFSGFLNEPDLPPEKIQQYTDIIIKSSDQLLAIIEDIISIASIEAGQVKVHEDELNINSLCNLIKDQFHSKAGKKNVSLDFQTRLAEEDANIKTDVTKLTQILTNLISNAVKFTQQGSVNFGYSVQNDQLEFYVEDSGIGIPLDMQEVIFNRFRQVETTDARQFGGSGLGLSISRAYVEMLGGKLWLTSEVGKGSTFYLSIPYNKAIPKTIPLIPSNKESHIDFKNKKTVLIAEDELSNFILLEEMLAGYGINIIRAVNGTEAVEMCKINPSIDLVLMDLKMPDMDGYEATSRIKEIKPDLFVIAQTAYSKQPDKNKALASGCSDFISKPLNKKVMLSKIIEQLRK